MTVSHLRFGPTADPLDVLGRRRPSFVACHQFGFLRTVNVLDGAKPGRPSCSTALTGPRTSGTGFLREVQQQLIDKRIEFCVIDADARRARGRAGRPHQHGHAGRASSHWRACCPQDAGDRSDQDRDPAHIRQAGARPCCSATSRPSTMALAGSTGRGSGERSHGDLARCGRTVPDERARVRPARHARIIAGRGRPVAGVRAASRRDLPGRARRSGEASHRQGDPELGPRDLHRLRQVRARLPPRRDPHEGLRADAAGRRARGRSCSRSPESKDSRAS